MDPRTGLDDVENKILDLTGTRALDRPFRSQSLIDYFLFFCIIEQHCMKM
jgi:hypothetical protein